MESSVEDKAGKKRDRNTTASRQDKQVANRALHRLISIYRDAQGLQQLIHSLEQEWGESCPVVANERCGTWYINPLPNNNEHTTTGTYRRSDPVPVPTCYFKSTDGHSGTWNVSLKRLNLHLLSLLSESKTILVVDSSVRKVLPDSLARTIPIWACVLNQLVVRFRRELDMPELANWDTDLHLPPFVPEEEYQQICGLLPERVDTLYKSQVIVQPKQFLERLTKPIHPVWYSGGERLDDTPMIRHGSKVKTPIVSMPLSTISGFCSNGSPPVSGSFYYTAGAADDQESWSRNLTPLLFWCNVRDFLHRVASKPLEDEMDTWLDSLVLESQQRLTNDNLEPSNKVDQLAAQRIGNLPVWIGTRRAGRPPDCWMHFDAILNVTDQDYDNMVDSSNHGVYYLKMPVAEGKRDKTQLERWLPVGLAFLWQHAVNSGRRVLVHCNQGKDRSVAVVMAFVCTTCSPVYPLMLPDTISKWDLNQLASPRMGRVPTEECLVFETSGLTQVVVDNLLGDNGRELFLTWIHNQQESPLKPLASKETLRIVLYLIRQDREVADPTRSTMQKLNRFFMSSSLYQ
eukprot:Nitzschia sp. Nitz4//scaffold159_size51929//31719//33494//NITZ4_006881-RA/size51929-snap-gene-0.63-mRNA-1//-1//CDS//3329537580//5830//frame0